MRQTIRRNVEVIRVDNIKLSMSGEEITETRSAQDCYFTDEETKACVDEAHKLRKRLCAHARARDSVIMCAQYDVDVIYHASYVDDKGENKGLPYKLLAFCQHVRGYTRS
jgi:imidazolonepropionase-like amidohydrolase